MLLEAMIAATCISERNGCGEITSAYYESNKELQQQVKYAEGVGKRIIRGHEYLVYVATPFYAVMAGKPASFKLHDKLMLNVDVKQQALALQWNY